MLSDDDFALPLVGEGEDSSASSCSDAEDFGAPEPLIVDAISAISSKQSADSAKVPSQAVHVPEVVAVQSIVSASSSSSKRLSPPPVLSACSALSKSEVCQGAPSSQAIGRKRLRHKSPSSSLQVPTAESLHRVDLEGHPCLRIYNLLPGWEQERLQKLLAVRKYRMFQQLKAGGCVTLHGANYLLKGLSEEEQFSVCQNAEKSFLLEQASKVNELPGYRGWAIAKLLLLPPELCTSKQKALETHLCRNKSILLTFQGDWGLIDKNISVDATTTVDNLMTQLRANSAVTCLVSEITSQYQALVDCKALKYFTMSCELCVGSWEAEKVVRVHFHVWILQDKGVKWDHCVFKGSVAHIKMDFTMQLQMTRHNRGAYFGAAFYCQVPKIGQISCAGNLEPFTHYSVRDAWVSALYTSKKITADVAENMCLLCLKDAERNIRQLKYVEKQRLVMEQRVRRSQCEQDILASQVPFNIFPEVVAWQKQYEVIRSRHQFLVLDGPSGTGKTRFAYSLGPSGDPQQAFFADCSGGLPDLREFRHSEHKLLLLDELSPATAISLKKLLQACEAPIRFTRMVRKSLWPPTNGPAPLELYRRLTDYGCRPMLSWYPLLRIVSCHHDGPNIFRAVVQVRLLCICHVQVFGQFCLACCSRVLRLSYNLAL